MEFTIWIGELLNMIDVNNIILFIAYICVADGLIHDNEIKLMETFLEENNISEETKENVRKILGDTEDKPKLEEILINLKRGGEETLKQALITGLNVAYCDGFFDPAEEDLFNKFIEVTNYNNEDYINIKESIIKSLDNKKESYNIVHEKILDNNLLFTLREVTSGKLRESIERGYNKFLLRENEYSEAIERNLKIAKKDLSIAEEEIEIIDNSYKKLIAKIDNIFEESKKYENSKDESEKEFYEILKNLQLTLKDIIINHIEQNKRTITKKKRALNYYTISFIGKTKAGKSTLHSVITGEGDEFIGKGQQRTTRYNRMYEWKRIRIIDTPGIGAPGGKTDEEIARSVVEESDLICYVLKNDSIQESEFNFLKVIKEHNKPVIILLNVKENLEDEVKFQLYLKDPEKWYKRKDDLSLEGHIKRIRRYAEEHYKNGYFEIFPVQLLAARLSNDEKYAKYKNILYKSSHIEDFLNALRVQIIEEGSIRRTQTMIDGSVYTLNQSLIKLKEYEEPLQKLYDKLEKNKKEIESKIENSFKENSKILEKELTNLFFDLKENKAMDFATNNYDAQKDEVGYRWDFFLEKIKFNETLETKINNISRNYIEEVKKVIQEIEENLALFSKIQLENISFQTTSIINLKAIGKIFGSIVGLVGAIIAFIPGLNIAGLVIGVVGGVITFLSGFFKSKEEKIREATQRLYNSIKESIEENEKKTIDKILNDFEKKHNDIKKFINDLIIKLQKNINIVISQIKPEITNLNQSINHLNKIYAYRIINYLKNKPVVELNKEEIDNIEVVRDYGRLFKIKSFYNIGKKEEEKISKILQEEIRFVKPMEVL